MLRYKRPDELVWLPVLSEQGGGADIHLHECGLAGAETIRAICARVEAGNMRGMVTISHAFVLGDNGEVDAVSTGYSCRKLSLNTCSLYLQELVMTLMSQIGRAHV